MNYISFPMTPTYFFPFCIFKNKVIRLITILAPESDYMVCQELYICHLFALLVLLLVLVILLYIFYSFSPYSLLSIVLKIPFHFSLFQYLIFVPYLIYLSFFFIVYTHCQTNILLILLESVE